jgi:prevent-host-death family protein
MFSEIGAFDAKTRLPELLRQVREGRRFTITHRGRPVADLVPSGAAPAGNAEAAIESMRNFERIANVDAEDVAAWIAAGRR